MGLIDQNAPTKPRRPIRIAAQLHPQHGDYPGLRAAVLRAEELGYDIAYNWDHFFPLYGDPDRARAARQLRFLSQPAAARRHRPDGRPDQSRSVDPRAWRGLVRTRLPRVRV